MPLEQPIGLSAFQKSILEMGRYSSITQIVPSTFTLQSLLFQNSERSFICNRLKYKRKPVIQITYCNLMVLKWTMIPRTRELFFIPGWDKKVKKVNVWLCEMCAVDCKMKLLKINHIVLLFYQASLHRKDMSCCCYTVNEEFTISYTVKNDSVS